MENRTRKLSAEKVYYIYIGISTLLLTLVTTVTEIYYINVVKMNAFQLVMVGTVLEISDLLFEIPTGLVADFKGRKLSVIFGVIITGISFIVEGVFPVFLIVLVSQVIWSVGYTLISGADSAWIADEIGEKKVELVFIKGAQIGQMLTLVGIFASTALATIKINLPIIAGGVLFIVLGLYLIVYMPETNFRPVEHEESNSLKKMLYSFKRSINIIAKSKILLIIIGIAAFEGIYSEGFDRLWTLHFLKNIKFPDVGMNQIMWFSVINSVAMILSIIILEVIQRKFEKEGKLTMVWALSIISFIIMISIMVFAVSGNFVMAFLSYCTCRIARNAHEPIYAAWINQNINEPELRATIISTKGQVSAAGQIIGGPVVGAIATILSVRIGIAISGALALAMVVLYVYVIRKIKCKMKG